LAQPIERIARLDLKDEVLIRMDSGNDSAENIALRRQSGHRFIIKRNLRQEDPVKWLSHAIAQQEGEPERPRVGKAVLGEAAQDIIDLYHDHGTSEQYHSELKSDLNLERFPSQSYASNALFLRLGALAYNLLRCMDELARSVREEQQESWPKRIKAVARRRVGSVIRDLILVACKRVSHAGREIIKLASAWPWSRVLIGIAAKLRAA